MQILNGRGIKDEGAWGKEKKGKGWEEVLGPYFFFKKKNAATAAIAAMAMMAMMM
ncbi:hypothetical protein DSECCO2_465990 [anaerobic digester metagenome]